MSTRLEKLAISELQDTLCGRHMLATLSGCDPAVLNDEKALLELVREAAAASGATVLNVISHCFEPHGVTAIALLAESHASLHTYPERKMVFWDCFTCGPNCSPEKALPILLKVLHPERINQELVFRPAG